ncbi:MAG: hypothetical protein EZS28_016392 [Streblomastix strix]|uniref:F-box domain-containing protein n=1 Tax=Streblomastix strix TaxID=222440 RepID=A0A5J4VZH1_9EUKA|nr:MAG: hypothetical protein EZS28_016392 [Streblomastix strix]
MQTSLVNLPEDILTRILGQCDGRTIFSVGNTCKSLQQKVNKNDELWRDCCLKEIDEMRDLADIRPDIFIRMTDTSMVKNTDQTELLKFGASSLGWQHTLRVHWDAARSKETGYLPKKLQLKIMNKINKDRTIQIILNIMFIGCLISLAILLPFAVGGRDLALEKQYSDIMGCFFIKNFTVVFLIFFSALIIHRIIFLIIAIKQSEIQNEKKMKNRFHMTNDSLDG